MAERRAVLSRRPIRSFVRREGRLTRAQARALETLLPRYGIEPHGPIDLDAAFGRRAARTLEIGFGDGEALAAMAAAQPEADFLGIEVYRPGVGHLLQLIEREGLSNVRVICADAVEVLERSLPRACLDRVLLLFPDPWPKQRHHKRRILTPAFVGLLVARLRPGGRLHMATDWEDYACSALQVLDTTPQLRNLAGRGQFSPTPAYRPQTRFERRGRRRGHEVWDLVYERV